MLNITVVELLILLIILPLAGGIVGYVMAGDRMRRSSGGKSPDELKEEFDAYQGGVTEHFQETAQLLEQMTAQYRSIYTHMAHGAAELCGSGTNNPRLEELKRLSLALDDAAGAVEEDVLEPEENALEPEENVVKSEQTAAKEAHT